MPKITLLGAGSGFTQPLFTDILLIDGLDRGTIGLVDVDAKRLEINVRLIGRLLELTGRTGWKVEASTDRREILKGTDYVISTVEVSGTKCVRHDNDIPYEYGIDQSIADTIGPGGVMKALRTLPVFLEILEDVKRLCPGALVMNYTNPMSIMTLASTRSTDQPFVGLCHSVQGTARHLAGFMGIPPEELVYRCGGINHMAWYTELTHKGRDVYPLLRGAAEIKENYDREPVRFEMMKHFGYFVTESSHHFSEYVPYFRKKRETLEKYCYHRENFGTSVYANNWPKWRKATDKRRRDMAAGRLEIPLKRSHEYAADIIAAHRFNRPTTIYGSVPNTGLIPNLPQTGVVEVGVTVDARGYTPEHFGPLPEQCAALCRSNMAVFELCVEGILNHDREAIVHALMLDPLSAAVCAPADLREMAGRLFRANRRYIPDWVRKEKKVKIRKPRVKQAPARAGAAEVSEMAERDVKKAGKKA